MTSRKNYLLAASVLLLIVAASAAGYYFRGPEAFQTPGFPERLDRTVEVHPGEIVREVDHVDDRRTNSTVAHTGGAVSELTYWPDTEKLRTGKTYGPADESGKRKLLIDAEMEPDGVTYRKLHQYYLSGELYLKMVHLQDGTSLRQYFFESGQLQRDQLLRVYRGKWMIFTEMVYRADGSLQERLTHGENQQWDRREFNENGVLVSHKAQSQYGSTYLEESFTADGKVVLKRLEQSHENTKVTLFHPSGVKISERVISGEVATGWHQVTIFDASGKKAYHQWWQYTSGGLRLWRLQEYGPDESFKRTFFFGTENDKLTVKSETIHSGGQEWGGARINRVYRDDGTLKEEERFGADNKSISKIEHASEENIRAVYDPEMTKMPPFEVPPQIIPYVPSMYP